MKPFYRKFFALALPVIVQNLIISGFHFVDNLMVGQLGKESVAGVALAGQVFFIMMLILFGICSGASVLTAQFWGKRDTVKIRQVTGVALMMSLGTALVFTLLGLLAPRQVLSIFTSDSAVLDAGEGYFRLVSTGYPFMALTMNLSIIMRSIERVRMPMIVYAITLTLNGFLNWILIFGALGFPRLGVNGAALATTVSRAIELTLFLVLIRATRNPLYGRLRDFLPESARQVKRIITETAPVILNEAFWGIGVSAFSVIFARMSTEALAGFQIAMRTADLFFVFLIGMSSACSTMIGNAIGSGKTALAWHYGRRFILLSLGAGALLALAVAASALPIPEFYKVSPLVKDYTRHVLWVYAGVLIFKAINIHLVVGILRSGGDNTVAMLMDALGLWTISLPLGLLGAFILKWPVAAVYILLCFEEILKTLYGLHRFKSRKWIRDVTTLSDPVPPLALYPPE